VEVQKPPWQAIKTHIGIKPEMKDVGAVAMRRPCRETLEPSSTKTWVAMLRCQVFSGLDVINASVPPHFYEVDIILIL
jgi:hypothetical protein